MSKLVVLRAPMRSRTDALDDGRGARRGLAAGVVGMGGVLDDVPAGADEAVAALERVDERAAARLRRFVAVPDGSFAWTLTDAGLHLGRITGGYRYDGSPEAVAADLVHVRPCDWLPAPVPDDEVPAAVHQTVERGGRNLQRIHPGDVEALTAEVWSRSR
ncbi:GAF domain-containing protein [Aeromicrobium sp. IC_218]|uniref:GAF domain-containing protein n=1 Tax=Aeromicrobium sp. IC_218 TaxID=2545468 RepID=UPI00103DFBB0|nr:GAF domain-containing protein [Aeromicrobium sp. IC_218]TCI96934.1 GAF domain-containing protein [Aeromicrobium sp. IC_218]